MTCLRRCTCHTGRRNSRRCSRSRRSSTICRSYRYHSWRRSRRYSRRHSRRRSRGCSLRRRSSRKRSSPKSHIDRSSRRTSRHSPTCSCRCMQRHSRSRRYPNPGTCTHRCEQEGRTRQHTVRGDHGGRVRSARVGRVRRGQRSQTCAYVQSDCLKQSQAKRKCKRLQAKRPELVDRK